jgi:hypothetical protein
MPVNDERTNLPFTARKIGGKCVGADGERRDVLILQLWSLVYKLYLYDTTNSMTSSYPLFLVFIISISSAFKADLAEPRLTLLNFKELFMFLTFPLRSCGHTKLV